MIPKKLYKASHSQFVEVTHEVELLEETREDLVVDANPGGAEAWGGGLELVAKAEGGFDIYKSTHSSSSTGAY